MSPISWPVVTGTLVVGSPAIYAAQVAGTLSVDTALVRLLLCAVGVWAIASMVASLSSSAVAANQAAQVPEPPAAAEAARAAESTDASAEDAA
ncbi:hypothetical protein [Nocardioides sp.]|uniref:hypothetical protein n=1 Tax=Nocardioides sp. TaxID=35761 RepID=UPI002ED836D6